MSVKRAFFWCCVFWVFGFGGGRLTSGWQLKRAMPICREDWHVTYDIEKPSDPWNCKPPEKPIVMAVPPCSGGAPPPPCAERRP